MRIETKSGQVILADNADYPLLWEYTWWVGGRDDMPYAYARIRKSGYPGKRISMHRLLMDPPPDMVVHHINNNGLDNRRINLQVTTQRVNIKYAHVNGGCIYMMKGRWRAQVRDETGKQISLGMFDAKEKASAVVQNWRYRKMLELEERGDPESMDLARAIEAALVL